MPTGGGSKEKPPPLTQVNTSIQTTVNICLSTELSTNFLVVVKAAKLIVQCEIFGNIYLNERGQALTDRTLLLRQGDNSMENKPESRQLFTIANVLILIQTDTTHASRKMAAPADGQCRQFLEGERGNKKGRLAVVGAGCHNRLPWERDKARGKARARVSRVDNNATHCNIGFYGILS
jgi:hypothetical protein